MNDKVKGKDRIKQQYTHRFQKLMEGKTQKENEDMLVGEKYVLNGHLTQSKEQIINIQERVDVTKKFTIVDNKLVYDGKECEKLIL